MPTNGEVADLTVQTQGERASKRVYIREPFELEHCVVWGTQDDGDSPWALFDFCEGELEVYNYNKASVDLF